MDYSTSTGTPYAYFSFGAAVTEVEIDCLTGDHQVSVESSEPAPHLLYLIAALVEKEFLQRDMLLPATV